MVAADPAYQDQKTNESFRRLWQILFNRFPWIDHGHWGSGGAGHSNRNAHFYAGRSDSSLCPGIPEPRQAQIPRQRSATSPSNGHRFVSRPVLGRLHHSLDV